MSAKAWLRAAVVGAGLVGAGVIKAETVAITAYFDGTLGSSDNRFVDTTPDIGCATSLGSFCTGKRFIQFITGGFTGIPIGIPGDGDSFPELKLPGAERTLTATNLDGQRIDLAFRFSAFRALINLAPLDSYDGLSSPTGCGPGAAIRDGTNVVVFGWNIPKSDERCFARYNGGGAVASPVIARNAFAYELTAPNPSAVHAGVYTGTLNYNVGFGGSPGDIEFPFTLRTDIEPVTLDFTLTVQHELKVDFPGSTIGVPVVAYLDPPGGWSAWQARGTPPPQLSREVPFRISMTGPLKMSMECEYYAGATCGIKNSAGPEIEPIEVAVSIPGVDLVAGGQVVKVPLPTDSSSAIKMVPARVLHGQRASVHFRTDAAATARIAAVEGARYEGIVTLVYDAAP